MMCLSCLDNWRLRQPKQPRKSIFRWLKENYQPMGGKTE